jgi:hypothetical protein
MFSVRRTRDSRNSARSLWARRHDARAEARIATAVIVNCSTSAPFSGDGFRSPCDIHRL